MQRPSLFVGRLYPSPLHTYRCIDVRIYMYVYAYVCRDTYSTLKHAYMHTHTSSSTHRYATHRASIHRCLLFLFRPGTAVSARQRRGRHGHDCDRPRERRCLVKKPGVQRGCAEREGATQAASWWRISLMATWILSCSTRGSHQHTSPSSPSNAPHSG